MNALDLITATVEPQSGFDLAAACARACGGKYVKTFSRVTKEIPAGTLRVTFYDDHINVIVQHQLGYPGTYWDCDTKTPKDFGAAVKTLAAKMEQFKDFPVPGYIAKARACVRELFT